MKIEMQTEPDHNIKNQEVGFALDIWWKLSQVKMSSENAISDYIQDVYFHTSWCGNDVFTSDLRDLIWISEYTEEKYPNCFGVVNVPEVN